MLLLYYFIYFIQNSFSELGSKPKITFKMDTTIPIKINEDSVNAEKVIK